MNVIKNEENVEERRKREREKSVTKTSNSDGCM